MTSVWTDAVLPAAILTAEVTAVGAAAHRVARRLAPESGASLDRAVVGLVTAVAHVVGVMLLLGALGLLGRGPVLAGDVVVTAVVLRLIKPVPTDQRRRSFPRPSTVVVALVGCWFAALDLVSSVGTVSNESDTNQYHLPNAAFWLRRGSLWPLPIATAGYFTNTYPSNGELAGLWLILPTHDDRIAYLAPLAFAVLVVLAIALITREIGGSARVGALAGLAVATSPLVWSTQVRSMMVDLPAAGGLTAGLALGLGARRRHGDRRWLVLSGVAFGLAIGAKYPALIPGLAGLAVVVALMTPGTRRRAALLLSAPTAAMAGFWFVRTWLATGNPIFPKGLTVAGHDVLTAGDSPLNAYATSLLEHVRRGDTAVLLRWARLGRSEVGPVLLLLGAATLVLGWRAVRTRERTWISLALLAGIAALAYVATPFTGGGPDGLAFLIASQLRYALPLLFLLAAVAGTLPARPATVATAAALVFNVVQIARGPVFRGDIDPSAAAVALAAVVAVVLVAGGSVELPSVAPRMAVLVGALFVAGTVATTVVLHHARPARSADLVDAALRSRGTPHAPVLLVGVLNLRPALGATLAHNVITPRGRGAAHEQPITDPAELDRQATSLHPALIIVGPSPIAGPKGWTPAGWHRVGTTGSGVVFSPPGNG